MYHFSVTGIRLAFTAALVTTAWSGFGRAETTTTRSDTGTYEYSFVDDDLLGSAFANQGDIFKGRAGFHRVLLLRPRGAFVVQLLKSVENL